MGRSPCCDKVGLKKGPWTPEEDQKLLAYVEEHGHGNWRALPSKAGLQRCGKSCRLRWTNYLRPDIKRGKFSFQEEQTIIQLHALLGNRWSAIATHLPKRTDNEIKNYWNTHLKKRLTKMGIDPVTHKPKNDALLSHDGARSKSAANLSHMAQWESARLEAEARLARQSKVGSMTLPLPPPPQPTPTRCIDVLRALRLGAASHSPTSTLSFSENGPTTVIEFMGSNEHQEEQIKEEGSSEGVQDDVDSHHHQYSDGTGISVPAFADISSSSQPIGGFIEGFTELLLCNFSDRNLSLDDEDGCGAGGGGGSDCGGTEDNKGYWNSILNLVNSPPSSSPLF